MGIEKALKKIGCSIEDNKIVGLSEEKAALFFSMRIVSDIQHVDILAGFADFVLDQGSSRVQGISLHHPERSAFPTIYRPSYGVITDQRVQTILDQLQTARSSYLSRAHGLSDVEAKTALEWLPHVIVFLDEAQDLSIECKDTSEKREKVTIHCVDYTLSYVDMHSADRKIKTDPLSILRRTLGLSDFFTRTIWATISTDFNVLKTTPKIEEDPTIRHRSVSGNCSPISFV